MANRQRGEATIKIDGEPYKIKITLGVLAELEDALGVNSPGGLNAILAHPTNRQLATIVETMINFDGEKIDAETIRNADFQPVEAIRSIEAAYKATLPTDPADEGKAESGEPEA